MLPSIFDATTIPALKEVINFTESRHKVLAGNIANLDVPGYKTRDLSVEEFHDRLKEAFQTHREQGNTWSEGLASSGPGDAMRRVRDSAKTILHLDDSDVGMEQQVTQVSQNQSQHNMAIAILSSQFRLLQAAISERV